MCIYINGKYTFSLQCVTSFFHRFGVVQLLDNYGINNYVFIVSCLRVCGKKINDFFPSLVQISWGMLSLYLFTVFSGLITRKDTYVHA